MMDTKDQFEDTQEIDLSGIQEAARMAFADLRDIPIEKKELILVIRGIVERIMMRDHMKLILGRGYGQTETVRQMDLRPFEAGQRGVSRQHAKIELYDDKLFITDLGSTNGTWLGGRRLEPHTPTIIKKGDELILGRLVIQVLFRNTANLRSS